MGRRVSLVAVFAAVSAGLLPTSASAIPAFARKYGVSCSACHTNWPRLNRFGINFKDNGYRMNRERDNPVTQPGTYWPLAFRTTVGYQYVNQTLVPVNPTASNPNGLATTQTGTFGFTGLDILTAGTLGEQFNFLVVFTPGLASAGFFTAPTLSGNDLESAWIGFTRLFGTPYLNLRVGKMNPDQPVDEHRSYSLTQLYEIYHFASPGTAVTYIPGANAGGIELYGHSELSDLRYSLFLSNEVGTPLFSSNIVSNPVLWAHVQYFMLTGSDFFAAFEPGIFGALGWQATKYLSAPGGGCDPAANPGACVSGTGSQAATYYRIGGELHFHFLSPVNPLTLDGAVMYGSDSAALINGGVNPDGTPTQAASWLGGFAELSYTPSPLWTFVFRYQRVAMLQQGSNQFSHAEGDFTGWSAVVRYYLEFSSRAGVALQAEFSQAAVTTAGLPSGMGPPLGSTGLLVVDFAY
jgi:hypothetical protein